MKELEVGMKTSLRGVRLKLRIKMMDLLGLIFRPVSTPSMDSVIRSVVERRMIFLYMIRNHRLPGMRIHVELVMLTVPGIQD